MDCLYRYIRNSYCEKYFAQSCQTLLMHLNAQLHTTACAIVERRQMDQLMTQMADNNRVGRQSVSSSQTSEILAAERTTSSRVSADFTLICDRQHDITGSRTRDLTNSIVFCHLGHSLIHLALLNASTSSSVYLYAGLQAC